MACSSGVVWFDRWLGREFFEADHKRLLLRQVDARGDLVFGRPAALPPGVPAGARPNPAWDFVAWCCDRHLADISPGLAAGLFDDVPALSYPPLPGADGRARPAVQGLLGDYAGARRSYLRAGLRPSRQRQAAVALATSFINHGGNGVAAMLAPAAMLARLARLVQVGEGAQRKRITAWSRTGRHESVLRATRLLPPEAVSTYLAANDSASAEVEGCATGVLRASGELSLAVSQDVGADVELQRAGVDRAGAGREDRDVARSRTGSRATDVRGGRGYGEPGVRQRVLCPGCQG